MSDTQEWHYDEAPHVCEKHPMKSWPHDDCAGPGVAIPEVVLRKAFPLVEAQA